jgi:hypothetical protein
MKRHSKTPQSFTGSIEYGIAGMNLLWVCDLHAWNVIGTADQIIF